MAVKLSPRLLAAAELVDTNGSVCDVGTDHALLPCYLYQKGVKNIIASDINDGPLVAARETIEKYIGADCPIRLVKSDGLRSIDYADNVIVAGMGGELIARIVSECSFLKPDISFILQPMTKAEILRRELYKNGFRITAERAAEEGDKLYVIIKAEYTGISEEISDAFSYTGLCKDKKYLEKQKSILLKAAESCKNSAPDRYSVLFATAQEIEKIINEV